VNAKCAKFPTISDWLNAGFSNADRAPPANMATSFQSSTHETGYDKTASRIIADAVSQHF
jgi:hypothetical protein